MSDAMSERAMKKARVWSALDVVPVLLALVLVGGLVYSLVSLLFVGHPDIGWSEHVMADAKAIARGHFPYGDPGTGYVGMLYTPLFPSACSAVCCSSSSPGPIAFGGWRGRSGSTNKRAFSVWPADSAS